MALTGPGTFGFERAWLAAAIKNLQPEPRLFTKGLRDEAMYLLGLGNKQVECLEYWMSKIGLVDRLGDITRLSPLGEMCAARDPSILEGLSWFVIHHSLCRQANGATNYWLAFRRTPQDFDRDSLVELYRQEEPKKSDRTYADAASVALAIIRNTEISSLLRLVRLEGDMIRRVQDPLAVKPTMLAFAVVDWMIRQRAKTASLNELVSSNGPAFPFGLSEPRLIELLQQSEEHYRKRLLSLSRTAGLDSVTLNWEGSAESVLDAAFRELTAGEDPVKALETAGDAIGQ